MPDIAIVLFSSEYQQTYPKDDSIASFLKQIARYPLLTAEEETNLARLIQEGVKIEEIKEKLTREFERQPSLSELATAANLSEAQLSLCLQRSYSAKQRMIGSNLRLVVSIAKRYLNRGVPFLDLIQEGALGLNRAAEKFDPDKGYKFSTYAYWWIRQGITRIIATHSRTIRLPIHILEQLNKLKKANRELKLNLHRHPTEEELAAFLNISGKQVHYLQELRQQSLSLNHRIGKDEFTELMDILEDNETPSPEAKLGEIMRREELLQVLAEVLTEREQNIIALRYGLVNGKSHTLQEVSQLFNLSCERVRQIQARAMRKLRLPKVAKRLKNWLR